jgi:branched-subunit amino acid transport protein
VTAWIAVALVALGSLGLRVAPFLVADRPAVTARLERSLRHAGPAALAALAVRGLQDHVTAVDGPGAVAACVAVAGAGWLAARRYPMAVVAGVGLVLQHAVAALLRTMW